MKNINELVDSLHLDNHLTAEDIPDLDLYMDQVIQLFETKFSGNKRYAEDKVLTKTMINNYAKGKLFFPIKNKKYSKEHLMLIAMIYQMKGSLSINDVKITLDKLNKKIIDDDSFNLEKLYDSYLVLEKANAVDFKENVQKTIDKVENETMKFQDKDAEYLSQLLSIASFVNMSNYYRKLAEKMVDGIERDQ